jgi:hypothetical protein
MDSHPPTKAVKKISHPIGIRKEHIAEEETLLYLRPKYDPHSPDEYTLKRYWDDSTIFTVTGRKYGDTRAREFRDASGLPMFESRPTSLAWRRPLLVRLPGKEDEELVDFRMGWEGYTLKFRNAASTDEKDVTIQVQVIESMAFTEYAALVDGQKVVDVRESLTMNKSLPTARARAASNHSLLPRQILEVLVAENFDLSLVSTFSRNSVVTLRLIVDRSGCPYSCTHGRHEVQFFSTYSEVK